MMPIYCYRCKKCSKEYEKLQKFDEEPLRTCDCGGELYRVIFPTSVHYKGAGFQTTEARGITGRKRKPKIKVGSVHNLPAEDRERILGKV
jgi:putative FmdB family regulatory protein